MNRLRSLPRLLLSAFLVLGAWPIPAMAAVPPTFSYQGNLWQNSIPVNATQTMTFRITDASGAVQYWSSGALPVAVTRGNFKVDLNPAGVSWDAITPYIEVTVAGAVLLPREPLNSVPYALMAASAEGAAQLASTSAWSAQQTFLNRVAVSSDLAVAGTLNRTADLSVGGPGYSVAFASGVTAGWFYGNGAGLTGITAALPANGVTTDTNQGVSGVKTFTSTLTVTGDAFSVGGATFVVAGGNIGVGTASPNTKLHISGAGSMGLRVESTDGTRAQIHLSSMPSSGWMLEAPGISGNSPAGTFGIVESGVANRLTIQNITGNVGIATASPVVKLDVNGGAAFRSSTTWTGMAAPTASAAGNGGIYFDSTVGKFKVSENGGGYVNLVGAGSSAGGWTESAPNVSLANPTDNVVVQSTLTVQGNAFSVGGSTLVVANGDIGIGTTIPGAKLDVKGNIAVGAALSPAVISADGGVLNLRGTTTVAIHTDSDNDTSGEIIFQKGVTAAPAEFMRITNAGNVGIGTTSPGTKLEANGEIRAASTGVNDDENISWKNGTRQWNWALYGTNQSMRLYSPTDNVEAMRVLSNGNVGIGTASPEAKLDVEGSAQFGSGAAKSTFSATGALTFPPTRATSTAR